MQSRAPYYGTIVVPTSSLIISNSCWLVYKQAVYMRPIPLSQLIHRADFYCFGGIPPSEYRKSIGSSIYPATYAIFTLIPTYPSERSISSARWVCSNTLIFSSRLCVESIAFWFYVSRCNHAQHLDYSCFLRPSFCPRTD